MGMSLSWPNVVESHHFEDNSTLFGNTLYLHPWQMDMLSTWAGMGCTNSLISIGSVLGLLFAGWIVRRLGRKKSLIVAVLPGLVGWALLGLAYNAYLMLIGRFLDGITSGMVTLTAMTYATEIPDAAFRGTISTICCFMFLMGACFCTAIGIALTWYYVALGNMCVLLVYICIVPFLPESPTFLVVTGQDDRAIKVLERLRGTYADITNEIKLLKKMNDEITSDTSWGFLLQKKVQKRILVLSILFLVQAYSGTAVLRANAVRILQDSGVTTNKSMVATLLLLLPIAGAFVLCHLVDRAGRKVCLAISLTLMSISYIFLGTRVYLQKSTVVSLIPLEPNNTAALPPYFTTERLVQRIT
ncbi:Facilitated trehalose transporter Tret1 [Portunus trituberculatus]|uniref:Facilitated trehalose transporter Tret1 n=1 Tax=Portunus trituberculatus TaxID=210409 RepID=A0A5B7G5R0_PORTR|nr:Facilitated trehalose transporter Tret1 [Portunus trituberculatus]